MILYYFNHSFNNIINEKSEKNIQLVTLKIQLFYEGEEFKNLINSFSKKLLLNR
jgi:hypothetical protein